MTFVAWLAALALGLSAGAVLAEGAVLVPFWRSLAPRDFLAWYRANAAVLLRFYGPLEVVAAALAVVAAVRARVAGSETFAALALAGGLAVAVLVFFPLYFRAANARFEGGAIPHDHVAAELARWARWHWVRTVFAIAAFGAATLGTR